VYRDDSPARGIAAGCRRHTAEGVRIVSRKSTTVVGALLALLSVGTAAPGDVNQSAVFEQVADKGAWSDLTAASDGTIWALGEFDGKLYHLSSSLVLQAADTFVHPFGPASDFPPFQPVCRGLAYIPASNTLVILNTSTGEIRQHSLTTGSQTGGTVALQAPAGAAIHSLTYDSTDGSLWTVNSAGDQLLAFDPATGALRRTVPFPGDSPPETLLYGTGVSCDIPNRTLFTLWGDIFQERAETVRILDAVSGSADTFAIPLDGLGVTDIGDTGIRSLAVATASDLLVLVNTSSEAGVGFKDTSILYRVDRARPAALSPTDLSCTANEAGEVVLTWQNQGTGAGNSYTQISILRSGSAIGQLSGFSQTFTDRNAPPGELVYEVRPVQGGVFVPSVACTVVSQRGAILDWIPFPGGTIAGIGADPATGELWVTDSKAVGSDRYLVWHFSADLQLLGSVEISSPQYVPHGITFCPDCPLVDPPRTILLVGNQSINRIQRHNLDGSAAGSGFFLRPELPGEEGWQYQARALAHDPNNGDYSLAVLIEALDEGSNKQNRIMWFNGAGNPASGGDPQIRVACTPSGPFAFVPEWGLDWSPVSGRFQSSINEGTIHEVDEFCNVTAFDLDPHLPAGPRSSTKVKDFAYLDNVMYVTSPATNSLFRILVYPAGDPFVRGNANNQNQVDVSDAVYILQYLFEPDIGEQPACMDAADANDDGVIDISDPVYLLFFLFGGGPVPPLPYPDPGFDETLEDNLTC
jgi:hypothetical protein